MTLKPSEKRLLIIFCIGGFIAANVGAWTILQQKNISLKVAKTKLDADYKHLKSLKDRVSEATEYQEILAKYLKAYASLDARDTHLGNFVSNAASQYGLKLAKNTPLAVEFPDPEKGGDFIKSGYQAEVAGGYKAIFQFIHKLQSPTDFHYIKSMTLTTRKNEQQDGAMDVVCNFVIQKWWHPDSQTLLDGQSPELAAAPVTPSATPAPVETPPAPTPAEAPAKAAPAEIPVADETPPAEPDASPAVAPAPPAPVQ